MSSHVFNAFASEVSAFLRSAGRSWTVPPEISFFLTGHPLSVLGGQLLTLSGHSLAIYDHVRAK